MFENDARFRALVDAIQDYAIYILDLSGNVTTWNKGAERNKQYTTEEIIGHPFSLFFTPEDAASGLPQRILETARAQGRYQGEGWRVRKDGSRFWASVVVSGIRDEQNQIVAFAKITRDLTERKRQEDELQFEKDRLQVTLHSIADGVICTDPSGHIVLMNPVAEELTGWIFLEAQGCPIEEVFHLLDSENQQIVNPIRPCLTHQRPFHLQENATLIARDGRVLEIQDSAAPVRTATGDILGTVLVFQDVTALRAAQREMEFRAAHDPLTALVNRRQFEIALEHGLQRSRQEGPEHTVCFLDLDRFKLVNDTAGHAAGDMLLRTVAQLLTSCVRESDVVARLGGDEFGIILNGCTVNQADKTLQNILERIEANEFHWEGQLFKVSASIGVTQATGDLDAETIMKEADVACYAAKNSGRNRVSIYLRGEGDGHARHQQLLIAADIRSAVRQNRLFLVLQPIVPLHGKSERHYEVLLRMRQPDGEILLPGRFIPAAERYDLMADLDRWVLAEILLRKADQLAAIEGLQLSVNLSANSVNDPKFPAFLVDLIQQSALPPNALTFEITETTLINNLVSARVLIDKLRSLGCRIALDDFGVGVSSFSYLRNFSVDYIKIDGSFIRNMQTNHVDYAIVSAINNIAQKIDALTVAEFVEDESTLEAVHDLGINFTQGYVHGEPQPLTMLLDQDATSG